MKEIVYGMSREIEVVEHGFYHDHEYYILNMGGFPTAYVENKVGVEDYDDNKISGVRVHGGFTFCDNLEHIQEPSSKIYLGWDYAHLGDYVSFFGIVDHMGKHWTYEEVLAEVHSVIEQLEKIEKDN